MEGRLRLFVGIGLQDRPNLEFYDGRDPIVKSRKLPTHVVSRATEGSTEGQHSPLTTVW